MNTTPIDQAARERIRHAIDESLLVEAAAGTGKTHELVQRLVNVLAAGVDVSRVVAVTFTRKAAGELKLRLRQALEVARVEAPSPEARAALDRALARLEQARVGTIHSFCAEILRERPVEAGIDPAFVELDDGEARRVFDQAFARYFQARLAAPTPTLERALARLAARSDARTPSERIADAGWQLVQWRDFGAPWATSHFDLEANLDGLAERVLELADLGAKGAEDDDLRRDLAPIFELTRWLERTEIDGGRRPEELEARLLDVRGPLKKIKAKKYGRYAEGLSRAEVVETKDKLVLDLESFARRADAQLAVALRAELSGLLDAYAQLKRRMGAVDFEDLLVGVRDLVRADERTRRHLQARFTHLFVDEYQDTDPLQTEILLLLSADDPAETDWRRVRPRPGSLFLVGDPKQSIYRFRRADVMLYSRVRAQLAERGVSVVHLTHSFRATAAIQDAINCAFAPEMLGDHPGQPGYVPLGGGPPAPKSQPSLVVAPVAYPHGKWSVAQFVVRQQLPATVGSFVDWLLHDSGWTVRDPADPEVRVPVAARHVAVLFRYITSWNSDATQPFTRDLEARGIPHLMVGSRTFKAREEVDALLAVASAIEWPEDELAVLSALRGPLFALEDDLLLRYRDARRRLFPFEAPADDLPPELEPVQDALQFLAELSEQRNRRAISATLTAVLARTRAHATLALRPAGDQVLANVQRVLDMARGFEMNGGLSFRGFVERLQAETERARSNESPAFEEDTDGVRMMTVHSAKGLEFPVVILADIASMERGKEPSRYIDADKNLVALRLLGCAPHELLDHADDERALEEAESVRLAYVAATRAKDLLVVPGIGEGTRKLSTDARRSWLAPLEKVLYPKVQDYKRAGPAPGVPVEGKRTVLGAPEDASRPPGPSVAPGLHTGRAGGPPVAWLDPSTLTLYPPHRYGLSHERYLAPGDGVAAEAGVRAHAAWRAATREATETGEIASVDLIRASETDLAPEGFVGLVDPLILPRTPDRPAGARFGTLVHAILRDVDLGADDEAVAALARMHGRLLGASAAEVEAAVAPVRAALEHDLLLRAQAALRCHREYPVVFDTEEGQRIDGSIDLAFLEDGAWIVVDFKTDADPQAHRAQHMRQMQWYVTALEGLTEAEVSGFLLYV